ncbi:MAG: hypothetical protein ACK6CU_16240, partial [Deltaproteobacteria bacterium]
MRPVDRAFWVVLSRTWSRWTDTLVVVKPETVVDWHRRGFFRFSTAPDGGSLTWRAPPPGRRHSGSRGTFSLALTGLGHVRRPLGAVDEDGHVVATRTMGLAHLACTAARPPPLRQPR